MRTKNILLHMCKGQILDVNLYLKLMIKLPLVLRGSVVAITSSSVLLDVEGNIASVFVKSKVDLSWVLVEGIVDASKVSDVDSSNPTSLVFVKSKVELSWVLVESIVDASNVSDVDC